MKTKTVTILLSMLAYAGCLMAQTSNIVVFSDAGKKFTVILNGVKQNPNPETNVKITGLNQPGYKAKVIFADPKMAPIDKNMYLQPGMEYVVAIKQNRKGDYVLRLQSQVAIAQAPPAPATQTVIVYGTPPPPAPTATSTTVTTSTTSAAVPTDNVNVGMSVGGVGVSMNVNAANTAATGTTTTTTTTTTSSTGANPAPRPNHYYQHSESHYDHHNNYEHHQHYANGCYGSLSPSDFAAAKSSIKNQSFSDGKMKVAKQILGSNCMSSEQVKQVMGLFSFESSKLKFAEFAYGRTTDPQNFYKLNDAFSFSSSVDELDKYMKSHPAH